jgi:ethanolamine utilization protein EutA (predicted chaperonin)
MSGPETGRLRKSSKELVADVWRMIVPGAGNQALGVRWRENRPTRVFNPDIEGGTSADAAGDSRGEEEE